MTAPHGPAANPAPFAPYVRRLEPPVQQQPMPRLPRLQPPPVPVPAAPVVYLDVAQMTRHSAA